MSLLDIETGIRHDGLTGAPQGGAIGVSP